MQKTLLVTGAAGFIGANFVHHVLASPGARVVGLDKLTYAGRRENLEGLAGDGRFHLEVGDIGDRVLVDRLLAEWRPDAVVNFAAESHVDRSIEGPEAFVETNVLGTVRLLESVRSHLAGLDEAARSAFRFLHVSTDEVYGELGETGAFSETTCYAPNSPYSASKAGSDHMVRAYHRTFGLPALITNCSNNYGPRQLPEKLIPLMILKGLHGERLPVYGDGRNVRDWLHVEDHCRAIERVLAQGRVGETYNIGGDSERSNLEVVEAICGILDALRPGPGGRGHSELIEFVSDRPGHDRRYAIDARKIRETLGWQPRESFESGLRRTVEWYLAHPGWWQPLAEGAILRRRGRAQAG